MSQLQDYDFRSEEVQEILGTPPSWILRSGTLLIIFGLFVIGALFYAIKFPDKIEGEITLNTTGDILEVLMPHSGYLNDIFVTDSMMVVKDQPLAVRKNDLDFTDYQKLKEQIDSLENVQKNEAYLVYPKMNLELGPFKRQYAGLVYSLEKFQESVKSDASLEQQGILKSSKIRKQQDIQRAKSERVNVSEIKKEQEKRLELLRTKHAEKENVTENMYRVKREIDVSKYEIKKIDNTISRLKEEIYDINQRLRKEGNNKQEGNLAYWDSFQIQLKDFARDIRIWEDDYLIAAPIDGEIIMYHSQWKNKFFERSKPIVGIVRPNTFNRDSTGYLADVNIGLEGYGNIAINQDVIVKFDSYPFKQFGVVRGKVANKGKVVKDKNHVIEVRIPKDLGTTFGKRLDKEPKMYGTVEILTEDRRFLARIFEQFRSIFKNN